MGRYPIRGPPTSFLKSRAYRGLGAAAGDPFGDGHPCELPVSAQIERDNVDLYFDPNTVALFEGRHSRVSDDRSIDRRQYFEREDIVQIGDIDLFELREDAPRGVAQVDVPDAESPGRRTLESAPFKAFVSSIGLPAISLSSTTTAVGISGALVVTSNRLTPRKRASTARRSPSFSPSETASRQRSNIELNQRGSISTRVVPAYIGSGIAISNRPSSSVRRSIPRGRTVTVDEGADYSDDEGLTPYRSIGAQNVRLDPPPIEPGRHRDVPSVDPVRNVYGLHRTVSSPPSEFQTSAPV